MRSHFKKFFCDQNGAVSVDWVVLTAGLAGLAILVLGLFSDSLDGLVEYIRVQLTAEDNGAAKTHHGKLHRIAAVATKSRHIRRLFCRGDQSGPRLASIAKR